MPFERLNKESRLFLSRWYLLEWQTAEERIKQIADSAEKILWIEWFSDKFYDYMWRWYYSLSTPVRTNFGNERWLPISCNTINVQDSVSDIMHSCWELWVMSKNGAWVWVYFWNVRERWAEITNNWFSSGSVHFMELFDKVADCINQWQSRRWFTTPYLPIDHWDIEEFLEIATEWNTIQRCTTAVVVPEWWMQEMLDWDKQKRKIRAKVIQARIERWFPYIMFKDNVNKNTPQCYKDNWLVIDSSNICSEALMHTDKDHSFVCCLASINLLHRDEIKNTDAIETMTYFLDAVMEDYIQKIESMEETSKKYMQKALNAAKRERALWLWVLGWHHYLQSNMIPFESEKAFELNKEIHLKINKDTDKASKDMAIIYWEPSLLKWYWRRNSFVTMIAPTTSSSFILDQVSQSIEPVMSNYYTKDLAKTKVTVKNKYLEKLLKEKWFNNNDTRESIRDYDGSVQHLEFLTHEEKMVFKTFREIEQLAIIIQAAERQPFVEQWQSLNLMITPSYTPKDISNLLIDAWKLWIKTLYYQHSVSQAQETVRSIKQASDIEKVCYIWCKSCEA